MLRIEDIDLIVSDFDGTLLPEGTMDLDPSAHEMVRLCRERGLCFAGASGRQYENMRELMAPVAEDMAYWSENGCILREGSEILASFPLDLYEVFPIIQEILAEGDCEIVISALKSCYIFSRTPAFINGMRRFVPKLQLLPGPEALFSLDDSIVKFSLYRLSPIDETFRRRYADRYGDRFHAAQSGIHWQDFTLGDKGKALARYCQLKGINPQRVLAFGDNYNDVEMLRSAGWAVATCGGALAAREAAGQCCHDVLKTILTFLREGELRLI